MRHSRDRVRELKYTNGPHITGTDKRYNTKNPASRITQNSPISSNSAPLDCVVSHASFWDTYNARAFVRVTENRIESNYPVMCAPCMMTDMVSSTYYDKVKAPFERATSCTPFHMCCVLEVSGQVARPPSTPIASEACLVAGLTSSV